MAAKCRINGVASSTNEEICSLYYINPEDIPVREIQVTRGPEA
jgi:hypothetical protein